MHYCDVIAKIEMKITIDNVATKEIEIIIKGDASSGKMKNLIDLLSSVGEERVSRSVIGKRDDRDYVLHIDDVESFYSIASQTYAYHKGDEYRLANRLFEAEQMYAQYGFRRISKSILLNCNHIKYIQIEFSGNYCVATKSDRKLTISRRYVGEVKKYIKEEM
ncbi:MAG: LytTR family transcriptional regulator [Clostridia bacterium]|nr:LytTR family transcriptional regulator [Clostridia bacterium]